MFSLNVTVELYFSGERIQNPVFESHELCTMALYWARQDLVFKKTTGLCLSLLYS